MVGLLCLLFIVFLFIDPCTMIAMAAIALFGYSLLRRHG